MNAANSSGTSVYAAVGRPGGWPRTRRSSPPAVSGRAECSLRAGLEWIAPGASAHRFRVVGVADAARSGGCIAGQADGVGDLAQVIVGEMVAVATQLSGQRALAEPLAAGGWRSGQIRRRVAEQAGVRPGAGPARCWPGTGRTGSTVAAGGGASISRDRRALPRWCAGGSSSARAARRPGPRTRRAGWSRRSAGRPG